MPKPSRSAFYFFATEYQRRHEERHGRRINITQAINECYDEWKNFSEDEKQPYKDLYDEWRINHRSNPETNDSTLHSKKKQKEEKILKQRDIPCEELKIHYDRFGIERDFLAFEYLPLDIDELLNMPIYLVNFQIFCKVDEEDGGQYVPAEFSIVRYSLAEGITLCRHVFIEPEPIPKGYMSACLENLKETHQIPFKDFAQASNKYSMIYDQLRAVLFPTDPVDLTETMADDRAVRRAKRARQPCVFFPSVEHEQTTRLFDWLQEKAEGRKPNRETRLVNFASIESLIMLLAELKKQRVSRDDIHRTFESAAYSYLIDERCSYHLHLGISHCSVVRCYAAAKLIGAYLNQLYVPNRTALSLSKVKRPTSSTMKSSGRNSVVSMSFSNKTESPVSTEIKAKITSRTMSSSQSSTSDVVDSIGSSYRASAQRSERIVRENVTDPTHHPTIVKMQQDNFHRLISTASSSTSIDQRSESSVQSNYSSDNQRMILSQRKQALLKALLNIDQQMEQLNMQ